jgi:hypothetical protein
VDQGFHRRDRTARAATPGRIAGQRTRPLAPDGSRTGWHFSFFSLPNLPELLLAGRERPSSHPHHSRAPPNPMKVTPYLFYWIERHFH